jgi:IclR family transcriptional regulator, acetate operon repressor
MAMSQTRNESIHKAVVLIRAVAQRPGVSARDLAAATGIPRATATRLVKTLVEEHVLIRRTPAGGLRVDPVFAAVIRPARSWDGLVAAAAQHLRPLRDETNESASLSVPSGPDRLICIEQLDGSSSVGVRNYVGEEFGVDESAAGPAYLATLPELERNAVMSRVDPARREALSTHVMAVGELGYADVSDVMDERGPSLAAVAAAVVVEGVAICVLAVSGPSGRFGAVERQRAGGLVAATASELESELRAHEFAQLRDRATV